MIFPANEIIEENWNTQIWYFVMAQRNMRIQFDPNINGCQSNCTGIESRFEWSNIDLIQLNCNTVQQLFVPPVISIWVYVIGLNVWSGCSDWSLSTEHVLIRQRARKQSSVSWHCMPNPITNKSGFATYHFHIACQESVVETHKLIEWITPHYDSANWFVIQINSTNFWGGLPSLTLRFYPSIPFHRNLPFSLKTGTEKSFHSFLSLKKLVR